MAEVSSDQNQPPFQTVPAFGAGDGVSDESDIDLSEVARTLWQRRILILSVTLVGTVLSAVMSFRMPNLYTATATIMPIDSSSDRLSSAMSALGALGGLASQAGVNLKGSVSDKFVALLTSRTVTENVITKYHLMPILFSDRWDPVHSTWKPGAWARDARSNQGPTMYDATRFMNRTMKAVSDPKTGMVSINVDLKDPQAAADIANDYIIELNAFLQRNSFSSAKHNKDFLQSQVNGVMKELGSMEAALKDFQEQHKLVSLDTQAEASVQAYAALKSQLTAKEMELSLQQNSVSADDVQLIGLQKEIAQLKEKIGSIENGASGGFVSFKDAPSLGMRFAQLKRDLLVKQKVFELLTQQLELAKLDEAKETLSFQVIDRAIAPDSKSGPRRPQIILVAALACFFLVSLFAVVSKNLSLRPR